MTSLEVGWATAAPGRVRDRWLAPVVFGFVLFVVLLATKAEHLLADPDTQWHIAIGRWIWQHRSVPTTDVFSHSYAGAPWIAKEWISQLILFAVDALAGWRGVAAMGAAIISGSLTWMFAWLSARMRPGVALALTLECLLLAQSHFLARPHLLVLPILIGWSIGLLRARERGEAPPPALAILMLAWTNMHGSFPLGMVLAAILAGEGVIMAPAGCRVRALRGWSVFLTATGVATMLSPFGWRAILVPLKMSGNGETLRYVLEWAPLAPDMLGVLAGAALVATFVILLLDVRANLFRIALAALIAYLMVRHVRFVATFGVVSPLLCARTLGKRFAPERGSADGAVPSLTTWIALAAGLGVSTAVLASVDPRPPAEVTPAPAFDAAMAAGVSGNVFNDYDFGGFLIAHGVPTFLDGRTDQLFLGDFIPDMVHAMDGKHDRQFVEMLDRHKIGWALVRTKSNASARFATTPGWSKLYGDAVADVWVRKPV